MARSSKGGDCISCSPIFPVDKLMLVKALRTALRWCRTSLSKFFMTTAVSATSS